MSSLCLWENWLILGYGMSTKYELLESILNLSGNIICRLLWLRYWDEVRLRYNGYNFSGSKNYAARIQVVMHSLPLTF